MRTFDVAVIGAGVFGSWTAWHLARSGRRVLLADAWSPAHNRASSGGETRIIRMGYGADEIYTRTAMRSLHLWSELFEHLREPLFFPTGVLWIARPDDSYSIATRETLARVGVPHEILSAGEIARHYPQMRLADRESFGIFEPESGAILARRAVKAVVGDAIAQGVEFTRELVGSPSKAGRVESLRTSSGEVLRADQFVFACGPWLPKLFPNLLGTKIFPTRQQVFFFATRAADSRFSPPNLPVWIDFGDPRGPYGFPDLDGRGVKLAFDLHGPAIDPDSADRTVSEESVENARRFMADRFPGLGAAPLVESRVCQYENTSNGDFLIDRHPDFENVWLIGGGSGHGFKHGPAVGEYVSALINGADHPVEPRFSVASKGDAQNRTVF